MTRPRHVLFLCTGNSARSILAEALLNAMGSGRFVAHSAGSHPRGEPHWMALQVLRDHGLSTEGLRSKSWTEFARPDAPSMDLVITVCDNAAGETCPVWPGRPIAAHWGIEDPAAVEGGGQRAAFEQAFGYLRDRMAALAALPLDDLHGAVLSAALRKIGAAQGGTAMVLGQAADA